MSETDRYEQRFHRVFDHGFPSAGGICVASCIDSHQARVLTEALNQRAQAVGALEEIAALSDTPGAWDRAYFRAKAIAREGLRSLEREAA